MGSHRPVVRLHLEGAVLTRVDPGRRETSMLMRTRPGWGALRAYLEGMDDLQRCARSSGPEVPQTSFIGMDGFRVLGLDSR